MGANPEVIDKPLTRDALGERYRELCADPRFANLPGAGLAQRSAFSIDLTGLFD